VRAFGRRLDRRQPPEDAGDQARVVRVQLLPALGEAVDVRRPADLTAVQADIDEPLRPHHLEVPADVRLVQPKLGRGLRHGHFPVRGQQLAERLPGGLDHSSIVSTPRPDIKRITTFYASFARNAVRTALVPARQAPNSGMPL